ncbi:hypothetical protein B9T31_17365 [Acinetobacter sp. ANC 4558]|uniref:hypothetical protein n=1 Tax=Acinetobacter sp. ANC 4558 TaxID=1977876 RepID=UPI000A32BC9E|nr:hypothetical protein [Acinetobacter sp. ANC 4558]OTG79068.1 hypothetical protein B9T31_17365 [Acinetobacter sp. ANC 4558]
MSDQVDLTNPEVQAAIQKAVDEQVQGLKTKNNELTQTNKDLKTELTGIKSQLEGVDLTAVKELLAKAGQDEETKLIAEGKIDEVIQKRTEKMRQDHEKQMTALTDKAAKAEAYANQFKQSVVKGQIAQAFSGIGGLAEATDDVTALALSQFALDEQGNAVMVGADGLPVIGKDGDTPLSPKEWVETLKENKPYFFPRPNGSGAPGSGTATKKWSDYSEAERAAIARENPAQFQQLLKTKDN